MSTSLSQILLKAFLLLVVATLVIVNARPNHFPENSQLAPESDTSNNNVFDSDVKPWQVEMLLQRLAEINSQGGWGDRNLRNPEVKRQSRYRQCYFNPISCFRK